MKNSKGIVIPTIEKSYYPRDQKKQVDFKSPDINKMQVVVINARTNIYIALDANPEEARSRYLNREEMKSKVHIASRKPAAT